jgi:hypothetical protein
MEDFQLWKSFHDPGLGHGTGEAKPLVAPVR